MTLRQPATATVSVHAQTPIAGRRIVVMGLGRFGGGVGVTHYLAGQKPESITITDLSSEPKLADSLSQMSDLLDDRTTKLKLGGHDERDFADADVVIVNPAVPRPWENRYLKIAQEAGAVLTTEIRLLVEQLQHNTVIGVTGTAGKSTTAAMIHHILTCAAQRSHLGGNIGGSLLNQLSDIQQNDFIVLELSSAMLYWLGEGVGLPQAPGWSPHVAVLTNIEPNHLDWHGSFEHYQQSKQNIFRYQQPGDHQVTPESLEIENCNDNALPLQIPGSHNQRNGLLAIHAVERAAAIASAEATEHLASFSGLPHRLQKVSSRGSQLFYNDSKSTTPQATVLAVRAFHDPSRVHLIAGGYDKGIDLSPIADLALEIAGLYTIGATGPRLAEGARAAKRVCTCGDLATAVRTALARMGERDVLLLSPGCASWDQFENYEQRGQQFCELVGEALNRKRRGR